MSAGASRLRLPSVQLLYSAAAACCALVAPVPSCDTATGPTIPSLSLTAYIADHGYFDNEPIYVVFQIANSGTDTAWVMPYHLAEQSLRADLVRSDGVVFGDWGIVADYVTPPGWKGVPIAPQSSFYEIGMLQDRWGQYETSLLNLYHSHHILTGKYQLQAAFFWDPRHVSPPFNASTTPFAVGSRSPAQDSLLARVNELVGMAWDSTERQWYLDSLVTYIERRVVTDPTDPYLPMLEVQKVITAAAVGYPPDSAVIERLTAAVYGDGTGRA